MQDRRRLMQLARRWVFDESHQRLMKTGGLRLAQWIDMHLLRLLNLCRDGCSLITRTTEHMVVLCYLLHCAEQKDLYQGAASTPSTLALAVYSLLSRLTKTLLFEDFCHSDLLPDRYHKRNIVSEFAAATPLEPSRGACIYGLIFDLGSVFQNESTNRQLLEEWLLKIIYSYIIYQCNSCLERLFLSPSSWLLNCIWLCIHWPVLLHRLCQSWPARTFQLDWLCWRRIR